VNSIKKAATNENRRYCTKMDIAASFVVKGKEGKLAEQKKRCVLY
jgi:hypothetical protein